MSLGRLVPAACLLAVSIAAQDFDDLKVERAADKLLFAEGLSMTLFNGR